MTPLQKQGGLRGYPRAVNSLPLLVNSLIRRAHTIPSDSQRFQEANGWHPSCSSSVRKDGARTSLRILLIDDNEAVLDARGFCCSVRATRSRLHQMAARAWLGWRLVNPWTSSSPTSTCRTSAGWRSWVRCGLDGRTVRVGIITGMMDELPKQREPLDVLFRKPVNLYELREAIKRLGLPRR